jgi:hypothetical protein
MLIKDVFKRHIFAFLPRIIRTFLVPFCIFIESIIVFETPHSLIPVLLIHSLNLGSNFFKFLRLHFLAFTVAPVFRFTVTQCKVGFMVFIVSESNHWLIVIHKDVIIFQYSYPQMFISPYLNSD